MIVVACMRVVSVAVDAFVKNVFLSGNEKFLESGVSPPDAVVYDRPSESGLGSPRPSIRTVERAKGLVHNGMSTSIFNN